MPRITKDYKQLHANKTDGLEDMSKVSEKCLQIREKTENLNRPVMNTEMETLIKSSKKKTKQKPSPTRNKSQDQVAKTNFSNI